MCFNVADVRSKFPILRTSIHGRPLIYLDNAATTQVSDSVLRIISEQYNYYEANVHRGVHYLSEMSTVRMENSRKIIADFLGTNDSSEIIFTSGTTASINLVAQSFSKKFLSEEDEILTTTMEHNSNLIPWQEVSYQKKGVCRILPFDKNGELDIDLLDQYLTSNIKLVSICAVSNVLGTVNPIKRIIDAAHSVGAKVLIDAAQAIRHFRFDVKELDCDFLAFSGHKIMGPTGIGVLYGKRELLSEMPPVSFGGGMVNFLTRDQIDYSDLPFKFEAGTPNIVGIIALGQAIKDFSDIADYSMPYEMRLLDYTYERLCKIRNISILGKPRQRRGAISFNIAGFHHTDLSFLLDKLGIAVRSGHHCAHLLSSAFGIQGSVRVSPAYYNTMEEIDQFINGLERLISLRK